ncbi:MAG TPA: DUF6498-containing protein [Candidatus Limnocylindrales bacterium]|nr:DUF6498-containing protein [Candidatus Limnocylindrales bacterium]
MTETSSSEAPAGSPETPATLPESPLGRAFELYRQTARSRSAVALLVANAIPLVGVVFLGWSLWTILVIYWIENGIVGLFNIPRILFAEGQLLPGRSAGAGYRAWAVQSVPGVGRAGMALFFTIHYGLFWAVHGAFVLILPSFMGLLGSGGPGPLVAPFPGDPGAPFIPGLGSLAPDAVGPFGTIEWPAVGLAAVGLFLSHGASFLLNYLGQGEFRRTWAAAQMFAPYGRVVVLHVTILVGGFAVAFLGAPIVMLLALVLLKTAFDLSLHLREHRGLAPAATSAALDD